MHTTCILILTVGFALGLSAGAPAREASILQKGPPAAMPDHPVPVASTTKATDTVLPKVFAAPNALADRLRLSAMIGEGPRMLIGIVDASTSNAFLVRPGDTLFGYEVVATDYKAETVTLRKGREEIKLRLKEDTNAIPPGVMGEHRPDLLPYMRRTKTLEEFLAEHPNVKTADEVKFEFPTNTQAVRTFEDFMKEHPEMAGVSNYVAEGLGPGIENARPPEITNDVSAPDPGKYGLGPGIEKALMELPPDQRPKMEDLAPGKVKTYEEFIKENEWRFKDKDTVTPSGAK